MTNPLQSNPAKQGKKLAIDIAKQIAKEPFEIAKTAVRQVSNIEAASDLGNSSSAQNEGMQNIPSENSQLSDEQRKIQGQRQLQALENEMKEIVEKKKMEQQKEDYFEKREELLEDQNKQISPLLVPTSKRTRNFFVGMRRKPKQDSSIQAERQQKRVENIMPPTG